MFRQLNFSSFFTFLGRNRLYTAINIFGLSVSLTFVLLIADYTLRQFTVDNFHRKADRIWVVGNEESAMTGYYLQKYLLDRYPEIEATCGVTVSGWNTDEETLEIGEQKYSARAHFADTTFFRMFDFELLAGDRREALAARDHVVLSESFARRVFGTFSPMGQVLRCPEYDKEYVVSGIVRDFDRTVFPECDIILRGEEATLRNRSINERMSNGASSVTFVLAREGADLEAKRAEMAEYFKEFYWMYTNNIRNEVTLTPLRELHFSDLNGGGRTPMRHGSRSLVMILFGVGAIILAFAVMNYINLTVAQTGFRAKEMATRRLVGASGGEVVLKFILESTLLCAAAFAVALCLAETAAPYASDLLGAKIAVWSDITPVTGACYVLFVLLLGIVAGIIPAVAVSHYKPIDIVRGTLRRRTKMVYSRVLIAIQNVITIVLIASSLTVWLQIRHLINAPLGYETKDILDISTSTFRDYGEIRRFRDELRQLPCVEAVALGCGTPIGGGNNNTISCGPDRMISFQTLVGDSAYFRMLGLELLQDNHISDAWYLNEQALRELEIDQTATNFKLGPDYSWNCDLAGVYRDFCIRSVLNPPTAVQLHNLGDFDRYWQDGSFNGNYHPWDILVKTTGDRKKALTAIRALYDRISEGVPMRAEYFEQQIENQYAEQRRMLRIVGIFTLVAVLISALGLVAMSTYYIRQKEQEVAVRKVFGSTRSEVLGRLVGRFMRTVGVAFVVACPVAWWMMERWLQDYSVRIALSPLIFLAAGLFAAAVALVAVWWQSERAARANPIDAVKDK